MATSSTHPYTCLACALAFTSAGLQRSHYSTDLHRYNAKRKVAGLGPLSADAFVQKVQERRGEQAAAGEPESNGRAGGRRCEACGKTFASEGAEKSHLASRKHREAVFRGATKATEQVMSPKQPDPSPSSSMPPLNDVDSGPSSSKLSLDDLIAARLRAASLVSPLSSPSTSCVFCSHSASASSSELFHHMRAAHSFFVPDQTYLVDPEGFLKHLAEKVTAWNVCVYCDQGFAGDVEAKTEETGKEGVRKGLYRVRKHMIDKAHCKLGWDTESQRLELSDYYDFRSSYPDYKPKAASDEDVLMASAEDDDGDETWEDVESDSQSTSTSDDGELPPQSNGGVSFGDTPFELILPSGRRIGHRALRHVYKANVVPYALEPDTTSSRENRLINRLALSASSPRPEPRGDDGPAREAGTVAQRLSHAARTGSLSSAALVPSRGGLGAFGKGREVVLARNKGEAKEAGRATREFSERRKAEAFRTRVGIKVGNNQKHCERPFRACPKTTKADPAPKDRDPLLQ